MSVHSLQYSSPYVSINQQFPLRNLQPVSINVTGAINNSSLIGGLIVSSTAANVTLTTDTATDIINFILDYYNENLFGNNNVNPSYGSQTIVVYPSFECLFVNNGPNNLILAGGANVTNGSAAGALTIPTGTKRSVLFVITGPAAITIYP